MKNNFKQSLFILTSDIPIWLINSPFFHKNRKHRLEQSQILERKMKIFFNIFKSNPVSNIYLINLATKLYNNKLWENIVFYK